MANKPANIRLVLAGERCCLDSETRITSSPGIYFLQRYSTEVHTAVDALRHIENCDWFSDTTDLWRSPFGIGKRRDGSYSFFLNQHRYSVGAKSEYNRQLNDRTALIQCKRQRSTKA